MNKVIETIFSLIVVLLMGGFCAFALIASDMEDFIEWLKKHKRQAMKKDILLLCMKYANSCKNCPRNKQCEKELENERRKEDERKHNKSNSK